MKQLVIVSLLFVVGLGATAQIRRTVAPRPKADSATAAAPAMAADGAKRKDMLKELGLNKQQLRKLKEMRQATQQQKAAIEADDKLTDMQRKQRLLELRRQQAAQTDSLLTPEQQQKMAKMRREAVQQKRAAKNGATTMETEQDL